MIIADALFASLLISSARMEPLELEFRRREPESGHINVSDEKIETSKLAIVVMDMWNYHWCKTCLLRAAALVPRMNKVLEMARELGIQVVFTPTDVTNTYAGTIPRERMAALPHHPMPEPSNFNPPAPPGWGGDMCGGAYDCIVNYGEQAMNPDLVIAEEDWISAHAQDLYNLGAGRGITHLIYMGIATNMCVLGKPEGMTPMTRLGFTCIIARDLTDAYSHNAGGDSLNQHTREAVAYIEKYIGPSINFVHELRKIGKWDEDWLVDPVLIAPWGAENRPQFFNSSVMVSLTMPNALDAEIHYTLDGSEPDQSKPLYTVPIEITETTKLRAIALKDGQKVSLESESYYVRMPAEPQLPNVFISDLETIWSSVPGYIPHWSGRDKKSFLPPQKDISYDQSPLQLRGVQYEKGMGVHAPSQLIYKLNPEYRRFVARAGVCESLREWDLGREIALYPSVTFKVFIDGQLMGESPVMNISEEPWRFDITIPDGSRIISLVVTDAGDGNRYDLANWVNAGFVIQPR